MMRATWLLGILVACGFADFAPTEATPLTPPAAYRLWHQSIGECAGLTGRFERITWYTVPGRDFSCPIGRCGGWFRPPHTIFLAQERVDDQSLVQHEILHDLLQEGGHPPIFDICGVR